MPNKKQFESMSFSSFPFEIQHLSMVEISEIYYKHIQHIYELLSMDKIAMIEIPAQNLVCRMIRISSEQFAVREVHDGGRVQKLISYSPIEFVNWLFASAPFIPFVGESHGEFWTEEEKSKL